MRYMWHFCSCICIGKQAVRHHHGSWVAVMWCVRRILSHSKESASRANLDNARSAYSVTTLHRWPGGVTEPVLNMKLTGICILKWNGDDKNANFLGSAIDVSNFGYFQVGPATRSST